jgi:type II secretory pathway pseudopilin PulG
LIIRRDDKGFTLIEIVTIVVVLGILGAFSLTFIDNATKTYMLAKKQGNLSREASYIMERITREIRNIQQPINYSNSPEYIFLYNTTPMDNNIWVFFYRDSNSNNLYRWSMWPSRLQIMGRNVTQITMAPASANACNDRVTISVTLADGDQAVTLNTTVSPKNFGTTYTDRCFNGDYEDVIQ